MNFSLSKIKLALKHTMLLLFFYKTHFYEINKTLLALVELSKGSSFIRPFPKFYKLYMFTNIEFISEKYLKYYSCIKIILINA